MPKFDAQLTEPPMCPFPLFIRTPVRWLRTHPHDLCKDPISKSGHILRFWGLGPQQNFLGGNGRCVSPPPLQFSAPGGVLGRGWGGGAWPHFQAKALLTRGPRGSHLLPPTLVTEVEPRQPGSLTNRQRLCPRPNFNGAPLSPLLAPEAPILASPIHVRPSQFWQESCKASFQSPRPLVIQPHPSSSPPCA